MGNGDCAFSGVAKAEDPTQTYPPSLHETAKELRRNAAAHLENNREKFLWANEDNQYFEALQVLRTDYAFGGLRSMEVMADMLKLTIGVHCALTGEHLQ